MVRTKLYYQNRINLLNNREKENSRIVKKLERQLRVLEKKDSKN